MCCGRGPDGAAESDAEERSASLTREMEGVAAIGTGC